MLLRGQAERRGAPSLPASPPAKSVSSGALQKQRVRTGECTTMMLVKKSSMCTQGSTQANDVYEKGINTHKSMTPVKTSIACTQGSKKA